jgi:hypothetical protein
MDWENWKDWTPGVICLIGSCFAMSTPLAILGAVLIWANDSTRRQGGE